MKYHQSVEYFFCILVDQKFLTQKTKCYEKTSILRNHNIIYLRLKYLQKNIFKGKKTNEKNRTPLAGASIYIPDLKIGARANEDGSYSTSSLPSGKYLV